MTRWFRFDRLREARTERALVGISALVLFALFSSQAWISEDAHITLRTVDNFVNGYGLRWNVDERVQTYTHPLWMLIVSGAYFFTRESYFTLTTIGLACSLAAYLVIARHMRGEPFALLACVFAPWALSPSGVRYATSGFENPLTLLLLALFATQFLRARLDSPPWARLCMIAALGAVNRLDALLLYAPALAYLALRDPRAVPWRRVALGFAPLGGWLLFSLFYYGFAFPNTAYAKLSSAIPRSLYLAHGLHYLADLVTTDPAAAVILAGGAFATMTGLARALGRERSSEGARLASLGAGALLYTAYVVWIGGDFLSGRFWVAPVLLSMLVCATALPRGVAWLRAAPRATAGGLAAVAFGSILGSCVVSKQALEHLPGFSRALPKGHVYLGPDLTWQITSEGAYFRKLGRDARRRALDDGHRTQVLSVIGIGGLAAGREVTILDLHALGDPLLARLPPARTDELKIGHLVRELPPGYRNARETGSLEGMDPDLARYYEVLRRVTAGPLLSRERLAALVRLNLGAYDELLDAYAGRRR